MQLDISIIFNETAQFCILLAIGYIAIKTRVFSSESLGTLSAYALKIAMPAMLVTKLPAATTREMLAQTLPLLLALPFWYALLAVGGVASARVCKMPPNTARVHIVQYTMGNIGVMGIILIIATLGDSSGIYMASVFFVDQCILWTICEMLSYPAEQKRGLNAASLKKVIKNPTIIGLFAALFMILAGWRPDNLIVDVLSGLGGTAKYISMIFIGGTLATLDLKKLPFISGSLIIVVVKMLVMPVFVFWLTGFFSGYLDITARLVLTLTTALPSLFAMSIMARSNGTDHENATMSVFVTTISSMVTIPLVSLIVNRML